MKSKRHHLKLWIVSLLIVCVVFNTVHARTHTIDLNTWEIRDLLRSALKTDYYDLRHMTLDPYSGAIDALIVLNRWCGGSLWEAHYTARINKQCEVVDGNVEILGTCWWLWLIPGLGWIILGIIESIKTGIEIERADKADRSFEKALCGILENR